MHRKRNYVKLFFVVLLTTITCCCFNSCEKDNHVTGLGSGTAIAIKKAGGNGGTTKKPRIIAVIDNHTLGMRFAKSIGMVKVNISNPACKTQIFYTKTPNEIWIILTESGDYKVTFTLPKGDEYYGEFSL